MRRVREKNNKSVYHINTITLYIIYIMVALIFEVKISYTLSKVFTIRFGNYDLGVPKNWI